jgi:hypothetical protein
VFASELIRANSFYFILQGFLIVLKLFGWDMPWWVILLPTIIALVIITFLLIIYTLALRKVYG